jgi:hypothetical protein
MTERSAEQVLALSQGVTQSRRPGRGVGMTEVEWVGCDNPLTMLDYLRGRASDRKLRLFACGCCCPWSRAEGLDPAVRRAVEVAERYADGLAGGDQLAPAAAEAFALSRAAAERWHEAVDEEGGQSDFSRPHQIDAAVAGAAAAAAGDPLDPRAVLWSLWQRWSGCGDQRRETFYRPFLERERREECDLLRDLLGNPFRPAAVDPAWLTWGDGLVARLAHAAYEERLLPAGLLDNDRLAVLADALEEAGCGEPQLLGHLRGGGTHYRGCFAVDALLGRS